VVTPFQDRRDAGRRLAARLQHYAGRSDVVVLGLARGGIPVAFEVALALKASLDVAVVRKLGVPGQEELAMGAIASGGARVINDELMSQWTIPAEDLDRVEARERQELERRERLYRGDREPIPLKNQTVLLVDDGLATGSTMRAAAVAARTFGANRVVAAAPVAAPDVCARLGPEVDASVCLMEPNPFWAVGIWFDDFRPTTDEEVRDLLREAAERPHASPPTSNSSSETIVARLRAIAKCVDPAGSSIAHLAESVADARIVMIGDASHGTQEFYELRAEITKRLIADHGFRAVAVEADWPDAERVHRYVCGLGEDRTAEEALSGFLRFPRWTWRNTVVRDFVTWLRAFNDQLPALAKVGFYGLDLYSRNNAVAAIIEYLDQVNPKSADEARIRFSAIDRIDQKSDDQQVDADAREDDVVQLLVNRRNEEAALALKDAQQNDFFSPALNDQLARDAGEYYRALYRGGAGSWNVRDHHMADTLDALLAHLDNDRRRGKVVVWGHNSHVGDAAATELSGRGEWNLGQLARQRHGDNVRLVGMSTYQGSVTTASGWDGPEERRLVPPGRPESYEALFHEVGEPAFLLMLRERCAASEELLQPRLQRALGVIYGPETDVGRDHFRTRLAEQFDALIYVDETTALEPLDRTNGWGRIEPVHRHA
jgi:erythromycin esterase-like protein/adenine/guanine phosphoribosyltransferase-like PRPP-binding protein